MATAFKQPDLQTLIGLHVSDLARDGYCVIRNAVSRSHIAALSADLDDRFRKTPLCDGGFYGRATKRFGGVLKRSRHAAALIEHELVLGITDRFLLPHCQRYNLNLTQGIEIHPGALAQFPHRDQDMWHGPKGEIEYLVNVMWPFTDYTADNGSTVIWPGSHKCQGVHSMPAEEAISIEMQPGDVLLFLGSTLHGGGENRTKQARRGMIVSYALGWLKPFENQWLVYPPEIARSFSRSLASLVGYSQHKPNLGNYEGRCPSILLHDNVPDYLAATDELLPEQYEGVANFITDQQTGAR